MDRLVVASFSLYFRHTPLSEEKLSCLYLLQLWHSFRFPPHPFWVPVDIYLVRQIIWYMKAKYPVNNKIVSCSHETSAGNLGLVMNQLSLTSAQFTFFVYMQKFSVMSLWAHAPGSANHSAHLQGNQTMRVFIWIFCEHDDMEIHQYWLKTKLYLLTWDCMNTKIRSAHLWDQVNFCAKFEEIPWEHYRDTVLRLSEWKQQCLDR